MCEAFRLEDQLDAVRAREQLCACWRYGALAQEACFQGLRAVAATQLAARARAGRRLQWRSAAGVGARCFQSGLIRGVWG